MDNENLTPQYRIEEYLEAIVEGWVDATMVAYPDYPSWRIEEFLDAFITYIWEDGDHPRHPCPEPAWRLEECLRAIYDVMTGAATPWPFPLPPTNRIEEYLAAIHAYLADGTELPVPEPAWRIEQWLAYALDAAKQGGGGTETTVTGTLPLVLANAMSNAIVSLTRYGLCTQDGTPTPDAPVDIMCNNGALKWDSVNQRVYADGTPEVLTVSGKNLLNPATNITGYYLSSNGTITASDDAQYTDLIPVEVGKRYTVSLISNRPVNDGTNRMHGYDSSGNWVRQILSGKPGIGMNIRWSKVTEIPSGIAYIRFSYSIDDENAMVEKGNTYPAPKYQPYFAPQTASVPTLLSVGDVKDEAELIHGTITRRVTACFYDGTQPVGDVYMSTTGGKDAGAIIVYPLATPTTEQITAQNLVTNEGTNVVDSVANVGPLTAEVTYKANA